MLGGATRAVFLAYKAIWAAIYPEGGCDADTRRRFEEEAREANARVLHWLAYVLSPLCVAAILLFIRRPESDPARVAWQLWVIRIMAMLGVFGLASAIVARRGRPVAAWRALG